MKTFVIIIFISIAASNSVVTAFNLECRFYTDHGWAAFEKIYQCKVKNDPNITSPENVLVTSINGTHKRGKSNDDVLGFWIHNKTVNFFPRGIEKFFKNLQLIAIQSSRLKTISSTDLQPFPNLLNLDLGANEIYSLSEEVFKFNTKVRALYLHTNQITEVYPEVFDNLKQLIYLYLKPNKCINLDAHNSTTDVQNVILEVKILCTKQPTTTTEVPESLECSVNCSSNISELSEDLKTFETSTKNGIEAMDYMKTKTNGASNTEQTVQNYEEKMTAINNHVDDVKISTEEIHIKGFQSVDSKLEQLRDEINDKMANLDAKLDKILKNLNISN